LQRGADTDKGRIAAGEANNAASARNREEQWGSGRKEGVAKCDLWVLLLEVLNSFLRNDPGVQKGIAVLAWENMYVNMK